MLTGGIYFVDGVWAGGGWEGESEGRNFGTVEGVAERVDSCDSSWEEVIRRCVTFRVVIG